MAHLVCIAGIFVFVFIQFTTSQGQDQDACQNAYNKINDNRCITVVMDSKSTNITVDCSKNCRTYYDNFISGCTPDDYKVCDCSGWLQISSRSNNLDTYS